MKGCLLGSGVTTIEVIVEIVVMVTDNARLDLDKNTITLEAVPRQLETKIKPTAKMEVN